MNFNKKKTLFGKVLIRAQFQSKIPYKQILKTPKIPKKGPFVTFCKGEVRITTMASLAVLVACCRQIGGLTY
jgi:hypothetical protein